MIRVLFIGGGMNGKLDTILYPSSQVTVMGDLPKPETYHRAGSHNGIKIFVHELVNQDDHYEITCELITAVINLQEQKEQGK